MQLTDICARDAQMYDISSTSRYGKPRSSSAFPAATGRRTSSAATESVQIVPIVGGGAGHGGNAHAANEFYVIEGAGKVYGMAGAEKSHGDDPLQFRRQERARRAGPAKTKPLGGSAGNEHGRPGADCRCRTSRRPTPWRARRCTPSAASRSTSTRGEFVAVVGPSGSGKSTFMHILGCLDRPTSGRYLLDGRDVSHLSDDELPTIRNRQIGFVFQGFNLLARTSARRERRAAAARTRTRSHRAARSAGAARWRRSPRSGWQNRAAHHPNQLSGGQQQRVAIARALLTIRAILFADEPTGNLDSRTSIEVMEIFQRLKDQRGITIVLITHEPQVAEYGSRIIRFKDGRVVSRLTPNTSRRAAAAELAAVALGPPGICRCHSCLAIAIALRALRRNRLQTSLTIAAA